MADPTEHITALAERIRRNGPSGIGLSHTVVEWTRQCWRNDATRADAEIIMNAFPKEFQ